MPSERRKARFRTAALYRRQESFVKILVCMKQVPQKDAPLKLNESGTWIREDLSYEVNEPDAYALEEALRQKEKHSGEVVVITSGPARASQVLREALAKGADRAIHLEDNAFGALDAFNTARAFAAAIKDEKFDLVFTGLQSDDYGYAQTGVILAELLGWPHATIIMQIEKQDGGIRVKRELEAGYFQYGDMPLPPPHRNKKTKKKADAESVHGRSPARSRRQSPENRAPVRTAENQENRNHRRLARGNGQEAYRKAPQRSTRVVVCCRRLVFPRVVGYVRQVTAVTGGSDHTATRTPSVPGGSYVPRTSRPGVVA